MGSPNAPLYFTFSDLERPKSRSRRVLNLISRIKEPSARERERERERESGLSSYEDS